MLADPFTGFTATTILAWLAIGAEIFFFPCPTKKGARRK